MSAVVVEEAAILGQGEKRRPVEKLAIGLIQQVIGEEPIGVADDDGFVATRRQPGKIFAQIRMHNEKRL